MKTNNNKNHNPIEGPDNKRREFLKKGVILGALTSIAGLSLITSCKNETDEDVSPAEDLMREHGVLNRIMLVSDACKVYLVNGEQFSLDALNNSAQIIRSFIEDYHEKLEEDFLFPRFEKANQLTDLVQVLRTQHQVGRKLTDQIISKNEYFALGEDFEDKEHELFGEDGFDSIVEKVAGIEEQLGILCLSDFTPLLQ